MKPHALLASSLLATAPVLGGCRETPAAPREAQKLPRPATSGMTVEEALRMRRSVRSFRDAPLSDAQLSALAFAAQGVTDGEGHRAAPSAGALYPLELRVLTAEGVFRYRPATHTLERLATDDRRAELARAALGQDALAQAPAVFVFTGVVARTAAKYGDRADRYVWMEAGHAAQNLLLQATALDLAGVPVGAFDDEAVKAALGSPADEAPLYLVPVGVAR